VTASPYGPFVDGRDPVERKAQFRALASICACFVGCSHRVVVALRKAECDAGAASTARDLLEDLPARVKRNILSIFSAVNFDDANRR
jgi:hypothetical protein